MRYYTPNEIKEKNKRIDKNKNNFLWFCLGFLLSVFLGLAYIGFLCLLYFIEVTGGGF